MIRIITDSTCDITQEEARQLNIEIVPLTIIFNDKEYKDGIDLNHEQFYEKLSTENTLPITSQVPPSSFEEVFQKYSSEEDSIIGIFLSSELSGTFQSAHIAAMNLNQNNIYLVDSRNVSIGTSLLIREAVKFRNQGMDAETIADHCNELALRIRTIAVVDTLKYLRKGGRLSASEAMLGSLLHINPIIAVVDGRIQVISKARGMKSAMNLLYKIIQETPADPTCSFVYGNAAAQGSMQTFMERSNELTKELSITTSSIGSAVGTHVGPGTFGFAYVPVAQSNQSANHTDSTYCA